jgi:hypothetical protein
MPADPPVLLGPDQRALLARHVSIIVGTRDADQRPHVMRAVGCRLDDDQRRLTVLMPLASGREVLADLRANGRVAVVVTEPSTNLALQLKGVDGVVAEAGPEDHALAERTLQGFVDEVGRLGFPAIVAQTILRHDEGLAAIRFTVAAAFEQTPGPAAGAPLAAVPAALPAAAAPPGVDGAVARASGRTTPP